MANAVPLYHATALPNLESIGEHGLQANRGGTGGATELAASLAGGDAEQLEAQRLRILNSANKVHLGSLTTASTYFNGFKYLTACDALWAKKTQELVDNYKREHNTPVLSDSQKEALRKKAFQDSAVAAGYARATEDRAMLRVHAHSSLGNSFEIDPDEQLQDAIGNFAVRTSLSIPNHMLWIHTEGGWIRITEFVSAASRPKTTLPGILAQSQLHKENTETFLKQADWRAWEAEKKKHEERKSPISDNAATSAAGGRKLSLQEAIALEKAKRAANKTPLPRPTTAQAPIITSPSAVPPAPPI